MKIWSDSLSYLNNVRDGYVRHIEKVLRGEHNDDGEGNCHLSDDLIPDDRSYYDAECRSECIGGDIEEGRSYYDGQTHFPLDHKYVFRLAEHHLQLANSLYMQPCNTSHWLVCNPSETGKIAVIDEEAFAFLSHFQVPTTLQEIVAPPRGTPIVSSLAAVLVFLDLGALCDLDQPSVAASKPSGEATLCKW